jgi:tetratricopeptide (TPR) repeat protein
MYLLIPLILILASAIGILFIVWRKLPRLKELAEAESSNGSMGGGGWRVLVYDLCPEVWNWARSIKVKEYTEMWLIEAEKFLRRLRLASLKMDRFSDFLIKKIRKRTYSNNGTSFPVAEISKDKQEIETKTDEKAELKKSEQRLIMEIAKNPKNMALYEELGDLYVKMGDYRDAKESYEAAIELNSNSEELKKKLSLVLEKLTPSK